MGGDSDRGLNLTPPNNIKVNNIEESKKAVASNPQLKKTGTTENPLISVNELF